MKQKMIKWLEEPEEKDYPAAQDYLSLTLKPPAAKALVSRLKRAQVRQFSAKDLFRASGLSAQEAGGGHMQKEKAKIMAGESLSPLLLYRDERAGKLVIADGYHRLCAVFSMDEDATVPCKIV